MDTINEPARATPIRYACQVLVVGGGVAGFAAAVAAARQGADTLLVERSGSVGGMATLAQVSPMYGFWSGDNQVVRGIAQEVVDNLGRYAGGTLGHQLLGQCATCCQDEDKCPTYGVKRVAIVNTDILKIVLPEMLTQAGVRLLLHTLVVAPIVEGSLVRGIIAETKGGRFAITAHTVIDCSGDGDVAAAAGAPFELGERATGRAKPPSMFFRIGDTALTRHRIVVEGNQEVGRLLLLRWPVAGEYIVNSPSGVAGFDATNPESVTSAYLKTLQQIFPRIEYLRRNVPGCENVRLLSVAPELGIRDSRRILGDYALTVDDELHDRKFADGIAAGCHPVDLHVASRQLGGRNIVRRHCGDFYHIPFRCLTPRQLDNVLVAGRCLSATFEGQGSPRVQATCMATGQAAGTAAALCAQEGIATRQVAIAVLQERLRADGAVL